MTAFRTSLLFMFSLLFTLLFLSPGMSAASPFPGAEKNGDGKDAHILLSSTSLDFDSIPVDTIVCSSVSFKNTGKEPLQLFTIFSDCGCTVSSYPTDPIPSGSEGEIKVSFNSQGRSPGAFRKNLRIRSNADNPRVILTVKGVIK